MSVRSAFHRLWAFVVLASVAQPVTFTVVGIAA